MSSIFLARELDLTVTAVDLWIPAADNERRIAEAGVGDRVRALSAEAHALPFDDEVFDLVVSVDAYHYFGTDDLYLGYLTRFLRPGGRLAVVSPATTIELDGTPPDGLADSWHWEFCSFHSPQWWRRHWTKTGLVAVDAADLVPDGWRDWHRFNVATLPSLDGWRAEAAQREVDMLETDQGETRGFVRLVATKPESSVAPDGHDGHLVSG